MRPASLLWLVPVFLATLAAAAAARQRPTLAPDDYGRWERLGAFALSPHGRWIAYGIARVDERSELRIRRLGGDDSTIVVPWGSDPRYSADGEWLAWIAGMSPEDRERLEQADEPVRTGAEIMGLDTGTRREFAQVSEFAFDASGRFLALHGYAPEEPEGKGADLRVLDLRSGGETTFGNVAEYVWSDVGSMLALALATGEDAGNGVQVYDAPTGRLSSLDAAGSAYRQLAWREGGADLAVLRSAGPAGEDGAAHELVAWRGVGSEPARYVLSAPAGGLGDTLDIVMRSRPRWSDDGAAIAFGVRPAERDSPESATDSTGAAADEEELAGVEIWHTKDVRVIPQQKAAASRDAGRSLLAVWRPDAGTVVRVGTDLLGTTAVLEGWRHGTERLAEPYPWGAMFGRPYHDMWIVDLGTGARHKALERVRYSWESAAGRYLLWFDGAHYWSYDVTTGERVNLSEAVPAAFADTAYDTPTDVLPPHGVGGWLEGDSAVLLYDEYDVWRVAPDGSGAERLTDGAFERIVHRVVRVRDEHPWLPAAAPLYLSLHGEWSEWRGYARLPPGGRVERLVYEPRLLSRLARADSADVFVYRAEAFDDSPDLYAAGPDLAGAERVTATNPFQADFAWSRAELVEFESESGRHLQGALYYPADHDPSRRYPMIVYTYEILSSGIHRYEVPSERDYYNYTAWTQDGYFVLLPDIVYRWREPGVSALEAVRPAVRRVVEMGLVDSARVGLIGHSWGGYQATFLPTRTDIFAASVAGAPLTDFVSFMGALHWNPGMPELSHWETGQARMEVPYWEDPEAHERNSPIHKVHELETPLLMAFGNEDGVVDWDQGTEFYNFARRAGKQMVLLVYDGEDHGFREKPNQIDYHRRILEWFGHYLKDDPAPAWITQGVPVDGVEEETRRVAQKNRDGTP